MFHGLLTLVWKPILLWKIFVKKPHNMLFSKKPKYVENHNMYTYLSLHTYTYFLSYSKISKVCSIFAIVASNVKLVVFKNW